MSLTSEQQETGINFSNGSDVAIVYTANNAFKKKLDELCKLYPKNFILQHFAGYNDGIKSYHISKKYISIRTPTILSEKQKANLNNLHNRYRETIAKKVPVAAK